DDSAAQSYAAMPVAARGQAFVAALGGAANLSEIDACTTRLRLVLADNQAVDEAALKRLGSRGLLRPSARGLQVVLGPIADQVAAEIRAAVRAPAAASGVVPSVTVAASAIIAPSTGVAPPTEPALVSAAAFDAPALLAALGGHGNISSLETAAGRLLIRT